MELNPDNMALVKRRVWNEAASPGPVPLLPQQAPCQRLALVRILLDLIRLVAALHLPQQPSTGHHLSPRQHGSSTSAPPLPDLTFPAQLNAVENAPGRNVFRSAGVSKSPSRSDNSLDANRSICRQWNERIGRWRVYFEPVVADRVISFLVLSQLLTPSLVVHNAKGIAKWRPPASRNGLEPCFAGELAASLTSEEVGRATIPVSIMQTRLDTVIHSAYWQFGRSLRRSGSYAALR